MKLGTVILFAAGMVLINGLIQPALSQQPGNYSAELSEWHQKRVESLKSENGWLNLEGLFWLDEGVNNFGTASTNKIVFPAGTIEPEAGFFERKGETVRLVPAKKTEIIIDGKKVTDQVVFSAELTRAPVASHKDLRWTIIKRDDKIGIRLRNLKSKHLSAFEGIKLFPADSGYRVSARLIPAGSQNKVVIKNILGQSNEQKLAGKLVFTLNNKEYALDALGEGQQLFIIFADETSGESTYGSGRFLYAAKPGADGVTVLDFNKAVNPPCAFTEFATCPLPPPQNVLAIAINAGEKNYGHH